MLLAGSHNDCCTCAGVTATSRMPHEHGHLTSGRVVWYPDDAAKCCSRIKPPRIIVTPTALTLPEYVSKRISL